MNLLFLDVDGVLNFHHVDPDVLCGEIHRDKVHLLNHILRKTNARIVLSSAWRYLVHRGEMNLAGFDWLLRSHGVLANRLVGITRPDTMRELKPYSGDPRDWAPMPLPNERGEQISDFLRTCVGMFGVACSRYVVVDDLDLGIAVAGHPFVQTDGAVGLTVADAVKVVELFSERMAA